MRPPPVLLHLPYMEPQNTCSQPIHTQRDTWLLPLQLMALPWVTGWWPAPSPSGEEDSPLLLRMQHCSSSPCHVNHQKSEIIQIAPETNLLRNLQTQTAVMMTVKHCCVHDLWIRWIIKSADTNCKHMEPSNIEKAISSHVYL